MDAYDGLAVEFFYLLNERVRGTSENRAFTFKLPETVLFKFGEPVRWFFCNKKGQFLRKNLKNLDI
jgi:hypothetical protein